MSSAGGHSTQLDIPVGGKSFRVACADAEVDTLLEAASYLNHKMDELRTGANIVGLERLAILAALNVAHELMQARSQGTFDTDAWRRIVNRMNDTIDTALNESAHP